MITRRELITGAAAVAAYAMLPRNASAATDPVASDRLPFGGTWEGIVGVKGGIPNRTQIYTTIQPYSGTPGAINTAIANCPANQVVQLGAGLFNLSASGSGDGAIMLTKNNVTLRGAVDGNGVPTTILNFTGSNSTVQIGWRGWDVANSGSFTTVNVSGGANRGSSALTLASAPGNLSAGMIMWISGAATSIIQGSGWSRWFGSRPFTQAVKVTAVSGTTVSFEPPINADYLAAASPQIHYRGAGDTISNSGIENLDLQCGSSGNPGTAASGSMFVKFFGTDSCWMKNVKTFRTTGGGTHHVYPYATYRTEIRHCEMRHIENSSSDSYAILPVHSSSMLIEDNYLHDLPNVMPMMGLSGSAYAYNYFVDEPYVMMNWLSQIVFFHGSHCHYNLFEGNWVAAHYNDATSSGQYAHSRNNVFLRERVPGWDPTGPKTSNTQAFSFEAHHDNVVIAGCVLGRAGTHKVYIGGTPNGGGDGAVIDADSTTKSTWQLLSNYNTANAAIPANEAVASGAAVVASYLHASKPAWFGSLPWPWCEPTNYTQSNNPQNFPAGYRATNGRDPVAGTQPAAPTNVRLLVS